MSTKDYPITTTAFLLDAEAVAYIYLSLDQGNIPEEIQALLDDGSFATKAKAGALPCDYSDVIMVNDVLSEDICFCGEFTGKITSVFPEMANSPIDLEFDGGVAFIEAARKPSLFHAAYESPDALLREFQKTLADNDIEFPEDFDWWAHIVTVDGTYFC